MDSPDSAVNRSNFAEIFTMALNNIMKIFMPKDRIFYSLFEEVADGSNKNGAVVKDGGQRTGY